MLGDATWPEVLRRYLLFTRAGGRGAAAAAAAAAAGLPPARLDDRAAALVAAHRLAEQPHWRCVPPLARRPSAGRACRLRRSSGERFNRTGPLMRSQQPPATPTGCRLPAQPAELLCEAGGLARCARQLLCAAARPSCAERARARAAGQAGRGAAPAPACRAVQRHHGGRHPEGRDRAARRPGARARG